MNNLNPEIEAYIMEQCKVKGIVIGKTQSKTFMCGSNSDIGVIVHKDRYYRHKWKFKTEDPKRYNYTVNSFIIPETLEEFKTICQILKVWQ